MKNFSFYNPVKIHFGKDAIENLSDEMGKFGKNILLVYGGGSIKKNGIYDETIKILKKLNKNIFELSGVMPNPRCEKVYEGIKIVKENNIDFMIAVGGGSVIDCTKAIAAGGKTDRDFWNCLYMNNENIEDAVPFGTILTIPATGSEMNCGSVISNWEKNIKTAYMHPLLFPKFSILDPVYTMTLPKEQMIYGTVDTLSHIMEIYLSKPNDGNLSDDISEAIFRNVVKSIRIAINNPQDYDARSNLMWDSTMALNGITRPGKEQDWTTHQIEHALSAHYDIPHGAGLAVVQPNYLKYIHLHATDMLARFAQNVWNVDGKGKTPEEIALEGINKLQDFFKEIGAPTTLKEVNIPESAISKIADTTNLIPGSFYKLNRDDVENVLKLCI